MFSEAFLMDNFLDIHLFDLAANFPQVELIFFCRRLYFAEEVLLEIFGLILLDGIRDLV